MVIRDVVENRHVLVVYHLHAQTGRCTVWVNHGKQNLGLVNFVPESHLPFVQIGIHRQTAVKGLKLESKIVLKERNMKFLCSRKFSAGTTQNVVLRLLFNLIFRKLLVNVKPPLSRPSAFLRVSAWRFCTTWLTVCRRPNGRRNKSWWTITINYQPGKDQAAMNKYDPTLLIRPTPYGLLVAILSGFFCNSFHSIKSSGKKNDWTRQVCKWIRRKVLW